MRQLTQREYQILFGMSSTADSYPALSTVLDLRDRKYPEETIRRHERTLQNGQRILELYREELPAPLEQQLIDHSAATGEEFEDFFNPEDFMTPNQLDLFRKGKTK